jgi:hypothetical protein
LSRINIIQFITEDYYVHHINITKLFKIKIKLN